VHRRRPELHRAHARRLHRGASLTASGLRAFSPGITPCVDEGSGVVPDSHGRDTLDSYGEACSRLTRGVVPVLLARGRTSCTRGRSIWPSPTRPLTVRTLSLTTAVGVRAVRDHHRRHRHHSLVPLLSSPYSISRSRITGPILTRHLLSSGHGLEGSTFRPFDDGATAFSQGTQPISTNYT
jgi:hypothetical protein